MPKTIEIETKAGVVRGAQREASAAFLGIPFAEPPVGPRRFAVPVPHNPWDGVRDATKYGPTPPQATTNFSARMPEPSIPGDCFLVLNVFTPKASGDRALPVLFFIHGGGFVGGSASSPWYDGASFNRNGVVTVSVSYRFGFDGFGWVEGAPNNRALRDVILGLEWVRDNIARFGGDPGNVTLAGQSAGAVIGYGLLSSPAAKDLFRRSWLMSGRPRSMTVTEARAVATAVAQAAGIEATRAGFESLSPAETIAAQARAVMFLAGKRTELEALRAVGDGVMRWGPVIDDDVVVSPVREGMTVGTGAGKPLVFGTTDHEFNDFADGHETAIDTVGRDDILDELGVPPVVARKYQSSHPALMATELVAQWITDNRYRRQVLALADARAHVGASTWLYRFSWASPVGGRALHCLDLPFFFDRLSAEGVRELAGPQPPQAVADQVHGAVVRFATTGDPGWPAYDRDQSTMAFGLHRSLEIDGYREVRSLADRG